MYKKALYAGTFDPFTNGHQDILQRALNLFNDVTVLVATSPNKQPLFSADERVEMITTIFESDQRVSVDSWEGLIVEYARKHGIGTVIRGLRPTGDFENEFQMASMNKKLYPELETIFLMTEGENYFVSSSLVKEILRHGGDVNDFLPEEILKKLKKRIIFNGS